MSAANERAAVPPIYANAMMHARKAPQKGQRLRARVLQEVWGASVGAPRRLWVMVLPRKVHEPREGWRAPRYVPGRASMEET